MHQPISGDSYSKRKARQFLRFCELWWVKTLVTPLFVAMPPALITTVVTTDNINKQIAVYLGPNLESFITNSPFVIIVGAYLYVVLLKTIFAGIEHHSKPTRELSLQDILAILKAVNLVVEDKYKRISGEAKRALRLPNLSPADIFSEITRPDQQIALLVRGVKSVFEFLDENNAHFRVGLLSVKDGKPYEWVAFEPASNPPRTQAQSLGAPTSTVSRAIKNKAIVVVDDIQEELSKNNKKERRFLKSNTQPNDEGSQLCYPIVHASTGEIEYVLTIAGNKKLCLLSKYSELYAWIIDFFATRISLEHSLLILKEKAHGGNQAAA